MRQHFYIYCPPPPQFPKRTTDSDAFRKLSLMDTVVIVLMVY